MDWKKLSALGFSMVKSLFLRGPYATYDLMGKISNTLLFILPGAFLISCTDEDLEPLYGEQVPGKVVVRGYSALEDSLQIAANGEMLEIGSYNSFKGEIIKDYDFVFYNNTTENIEIINKETGDILHAYSFTAANPADTLSFYANDGIWLEDVLSFEPGILSGTGFTGYKFIFPTMNRYSDSGYNGPLDAIIKKTNGEVLGVAENITKDSFSSFVEFPFSPPPILNIELVKHGTTDSYIAGGQVIVQVVMQNNKSRLIVLNEKKDETGTFAGVDGTINLVDYFDF